MLAVLQSTSVLLLLFILTHPCSSNSPTLAQMMAMLCTFAGTPVSAHAYFTQRLRHKQAAAHGSSATAAQLPCVFEQGEGEDSLAAAQAELAAEEEQLQEMQEEEEEMGDWRHRIMLAEEVDALEVRSTHGSHKYCCYKTGGTWMTCTLHML
jgi:hypothetical protein